MPDFSLETAVSHPLHLVHIAGLDEAGRGALAGPVVAAAVIFPLNDPQLEKLLHQVNDSKQLTAKTRERLFGLIIEHALAYGIGSVSAARIDQMGILPATKEAMKTAVSHLSPAPHFLLIDGNFTLRSINLPQQAIVKGDSKSLSIAAASILAKVIRDRYMVEQDSQYPVYGFGRHKGYGTAYHLDAIAQHGPCPLHRHTFDPLRHKLL